MGWDVLFWKRLECIWDRLLHAQTGPHTWEAEEFNELPALRRMRGLPPMTCSPPPEASRVRVGCMEIEVSALRLGSNIGHVTSRLCQTKAGKRETVSCQAVSILQSSESRAGQVQLQNLRQNPLKPPEAETDPFENGLCRRFIWNRIIETWCFAFFRATFASEREAVTPQAGKNLSRYLYTVNLIYLYILVY